jgi:hypothetical protein
MAITPLQDCVYLTRTGKWRKGELHVAQHDAEAARRRRPDALRRRDAREDGARRHRRVCERLRQEVDRRAGAGLTDAEDGLREAGL